MADECPRGADPLESGRRPASAGRLTERRSDSSLAARTILRFNLNAFTFSQDDMEIFIEDIVDSGGRLYRIEYRCNPDGSAALAYCLHSPWSSPAISMTSAHLSADGRIDTAARPADLESTIRRARGWCEYYSGVCEQCGVPAC